MAHSRKSIRRSSTSGKQHIQGLLDNTPSHETIRTEVQFAADNGNIHAIRTGSAVGDQARLFEIVDRAAPVVLVKDTESVATLGDISSNTLLLPSSIGSLKGLEKRGEIAVASGGIADTWRGSWNNQQVAFKAFRIYPPHDLQEAKKILWTLVPTWKRLAHENVLPFHDVDTSIFQLALVYDWGYNGNIMQYLESHPNASRSELLLQVAKGLQYLHSLDVVHGDLKGTNVLISKAGKAQVCDYGLSSIISNTTFTIAATPGVAGSSRWLAPEIINPPCKASSKPPTASRFADVFAFAMLTVEVFAGRVPFSDVGKIRAALQIVRGERPGKPQAAEQLGLTMEMWKLIERCWDADPNKRPTIDEVVRTWEGFANGGNSRASVSKTSGHHSRSTGSSTNHTENTRRPMRRKRLCGLF